MRNPSGKTKAIVAYLTFVGLLIAYFMNKDDRHEFATWHIKNMFGLVVLLFFAVALQSYAVGVYIYWTTVLLWVISLVFALLNKKQGIPFLSEKFQSWFTFLN